MNTLARDGTGASDIMLITQLYKLYDPTSVVSVTETGQIKASGGVTDRVKSIVSAFNGEGLLTPELRQQVVDAGLAKFTDAYRDQNKLYTDANQRAARMGVNLPSAVPDVKDPQLAQYMDLITVKKMAPKKAVTIDGIDYQARLSVDGSYYVETPNGRRKINVGAE
jgi:hypothetical protein